MSGINRINTGSNVPLSTNFSVGRQSPDLSFGKRVQAGLSATASVVGSGVGIVGSSFTGGPAIVSAAVSSARTLGGQQSSGAFNTTYAGHAGLPMASAAPASFNSTVNKGAPSSGSSVSNSMKEGGAEASVDLDASHQRNMELLGIQSALQQENLMFSSLSNTLKTRHDTAKNSIANLR